MTGVNAEALGALVTELTKRPEFISKTLAFVQLQQSETWVAELLGATVGISDRMGHHAFAMKPEAFELMVQEHVQQFALACTTAAKMQRLYGALIQESPEWLARRAGDGGGEEDGAGLPGKCSRPIEAVPNATEPLTETLNFERSAS